jgi:hypothetical protein
LEMSTSFPIATSWTSPTLHLTLSSWVPML